MEKKAVNGITLAYEDRGQGEVLVLLHGFCGSSGYWAKVIPALSQKYRCIVPDLRGHGASDAPMGPYSIEQMADDIAELLEKLDIPSYTVLGHSLGGYIALSHAERYSSRLKAFGLIHSTAYPDNEEGKEKRLKAVSDIQAKGITAFVDGLVPGLFAEGHEAAMAREVDTAREIGYKTPPQGAAGAALAMRERPDRREVLSTTKLPVLLVAGEGDRAVSLDRTFTAEGPNITKSVIKGAGHMSMYEAPEQLILVIDDFLGTVIEGKQR
ncbi:alpha/beta hydrolase [Paenibacillus sp. CAA11]|uniref:alpha/beta hydrolase n=1 Tax=Paenibacillus sp. CAA11 TaxID=1532905 RepID=UPI000D3DA6CB|nr:alpha/beta hydrolase [Paenibacillus sp. CAA11]AWB45973.1 alpha/beta hydrolase [Paenibacillus sp. CAA11]